MNPSNEDHADLRPIDPATGTPFGPLPTPGYYPGFSTLSQQDFWDAHTRDVVLDRVENVPPIRFFSADQARLLEAICARVVPQDDRDVDHKIPIVPQIDKRLYEDKGDGYRFEDMPPDREAFTLGLQAIEQMARERYGRRFIDLAAREQEELLGALHDGKPWAAHDIWDRMPVNQFWKILVKDCAENYYAHPWAWDEIGFGGPAYPRAYMRLENGQPEPWEVRERRYDWVAPEGARSDGYEPVGGEDDHYGSPGQGGTH